ncbi:4'-phosphopantetheinyl transferase superfamily protein [Streptomyces sp. OfavH-34-F]|uniref:4'-phosphopantetheinyl transferase family protein n=1 Tax=Streptomyces sp. OfavH-34-F TaxID=2917760 RepID=UPI001EF26835|nr:4'-phosphopantetheinyl transferase superfamily protein [Streptomyces sp. OfavH-34-F]MCG7524265.1 4'-phosphopantetheinyl transferase superfamily protein [Streptomyces sp. OfavH-34-F]
MSLLEPGPPSALDSLLLPTALPPLPAALPPPADPGSGGPRLWLVATAAHEESAARYAPLVLAPAELARADEFRRPTDRATYLCAHVGLRRVLGSHLGVAPRTVSVVRAPCPCCGEPHGRPVLPGEPLHFSLSHCEGLSLIAVAAAPVGVDVEPVPGARTLTEAADVVHPLEAAELAALAPESRPAAFARVWTRKEAYLKGLGIGLGADPSTEYVGAGPAPAAPAGWLIADIAAPAGHRAAVAVRRIGGVGAGPD